jgi:hypothetical protein
LVARRRKPTSTAVISSCGPGTILGLFVVHIVSWAMNGVDSAHASLSGIQYDDLRQNESCEEASQDVKAYYRGLAEGTGELRADFLDAFWHVAFAT